MAQFTSDSTGNNHFCQHMVRLSVLYDQYFGGLESAALDGANTWKTFWNITIPQLKPILISIAMLDFIWTIQSFSVIWMLTGGGPVKSTETLSIYIYKLAFNRTQYAHASTAAVIVLAVCIIIAVFYVKQQRKVRE